MARSPMVCHLLQAMQRMQQGNGHVQDPLVQQQQQRIPMQPIQPRLPAHLQASYGAGLSPRAGLASQYMIPVAQPSLRAPAESSHPPSPGELGIMPCHDSASLRFILLSSC